MILKLSGDQLVNQTIVLIERIAGLALGLVTLLVVLSAVGRYIFASPIPDAFDLSRLLLGVSIAWGLASLGYHGTHIKVDLLAHSLPRKWNKLMNAFAWSVLLIFSILLAWKIGERTFSAYSGGDATMELRLPHWPFFLAIWLGIVASVFTVAVRLWRVVKWGHDLGEFDSVEDHIAEEGKIL